MWENEDFHQFFFLVAPLACGILVPQGGIKPTSLAVEAQSLHHWTSREAPRLLLLIMRKD